MSETMMHPAVDPTVRIGFLEAELMDLRAERAESDSRLKQMLAAVSAFRDGEFSVRMPGDWDGTSFRIAEAFNQALAHDERISREIGRLSQNVGKEGRLKQRMTVPGALGGWASTVDSLNMLMDDLVRPTTEIARTIGAVAKGDLGQSMELSVDGRPLKGEFLRSATLVNSMIEQLSVFTSEVTRVAREVGTEGKLGGQAQVKGVSGVWKELTDSVNQMAGNLTAQVRNIAEVTIAVANGDLSKKITVDVRGEILQLKETINTMVEQLRSFASEVTRVAREVGTEGRLGVQAVVPGVAGTWKDLTDSVNTMGGNLTSQVRNIAEVTTAVARGDLNRKITVDVKGEILELKNTINTMVDQLNSFAGEVTRVAREVGTEGKLGGQAQVAGVGGTWKDLTDNVNFMASNLTEQVRGIVKVVTAVANGNLSQRLTVQAKGEVAALADTINNMTDTLATFADQVTNVAREVGVDGRLGGQANVPGAAGTWKDLTGNVNLLAANLTTQVRAIAEVATAVTKGDLTRSIQVETRGEVAELKDNINTMISNLRETTESNREQDWLKTNLARFTGMLQGQRELNTVGQLLLTELAPLVNAHQGTIYHLVAGDAEGELSLLASYAQGMALPGKLRLGQGLVGQCAIEKRRILLSDVPADFVKIDSSLGEAKRVSVIVLPVLFEGQTKAVIELASVQNFSTGSLAFLELLTQSIGAVFNTIEATMRTEGLLTQSQQLTVELQSRQAELQQTNEELGTKARLLAEQNAEVERKNSEVEQARRALEEQAAELALTSKYKSEFLANMSHELRTPLNSILILSQQLAGNNGGNLSAKEVEFSRNINSSGSDLLNLINDILDLSKIESGTVTVEIEEITFSGLRDTIERNFRQVAEAKNLPLRVRFSEDLPRYLESDGKRLQQILKNLLSNAVKFTFRGHVEMRVGLATEGWNPDHPALAKATQVLAFEVEDTGIGVPPDKQRLIFEAFQQADAGTSRKYGGTGLGLAISRELSRLLGGEIRLVSEPGKGSEFTLYLPQSYNPARNARHARASVAPAMASESNVVALNRARPVPPAPPAEGDDGWSYDEAERQASESTMFSNAADDDRDGIAAGDRVLLIVENDLAFARVLLAGARAAGFKGLVTSTGASALTMAREFHPSVITLDIHLPDMSGWRILDRLKGDLATRHVPICVVSTDDARDRALRSGALGFLAKPLQSSDEADAVIAQLHAYADRRTKRLAVVMPPSPRRSAFIATLDTDVDVVLAEDRESARHALADADVLVVEDTLADFGPEDVLDVVAERPGICQLPVVLYHGGVAETGNWNQRRAGLTIAEAATLPELRMQTALWLHRSPTALSDADREAIETLLVRSCPLKGRKALIVDDDMRNIFALATVLDEEGMVIVSADNGREAIRLVQEDETIDIVLMDIMMPEMDGIATMKEIRKLPRGRELPMVAVTAKAMKGDRQKCIDAGAWDYISKPVDPRYLMSVLRGWLCR